MTFRISLTLSLVAALWGMEIQSAVAQQKQTADFLIAEKPLRLAILNRYQQKISSAEQRLFQSFVPMRVEEYNATLSDNFTRCMTVGIGPSTFHLLRDSDIALTNNDKAGYLGAFRNCVIVDDTISVLRDDAVTISPKFSASNEIRITKGSRIRRIFRKNRSDYVEVLGKSGVYGWGYFSTRREGETWEVLKGRLAVRQGTIPEAVRDRVRTRIGEVNRLLGDLFAQLNTESASKRSVPQWEVNIQDTEIVCTINEHEYAETFSGSMQYIVNDLENVVRGTDYAVRYIDGLIEIKKK